jgi:hypothetical protein
MSVRPAISPADELQRAAEVLSKNWTLALPTALASVVLSAILIFVVVAVVGSLLLGSFAGGHLGAAAGLGSGVIVAGCAGLLGVGLLVIAQAVVIHASEDAWQGRSPNLAASLGAVLGRLPDLLVATIIMGVIAVVLCVTVIGIPFTFVEGYFFMYAAPAVILGGESGTRALGTSIRIARSRVGESFVGFLGLIAAGIVGAIANSLVGHIPIVNLVTAFAIGGLTSAYAALVQARFYDLLRVPAAYPVI